MIGYLSFIIGLLLLSLLLLLVTEVQRQDEFTQLFWQLEHGREMRIGFVFAGILTVIGLVRSILVLIFCIAPGTGASNRYGADPLRPDAGMGGAGAAGSTPPYAPPPTPGGYTGGSEPAPHPDLPQAGQSPEGQGSSRYCTQCGTQLQGEERFCTYCGTAI